MSHNTVYLPQSFSDCLFAMSHIYTVYILYIYCIYIYIYVYSCVFGLHMGTQKLPTFSNVHHS